MNRKTVYWDDVKEGDELHTDTREITRTMVVATAIASRDFYPVHHDQGFAHASGARDIFINILTTNGLVSKYLTDWSGPEGEIKKFSFRLGMSGYVGETLTMVGKVGNKYTEGDEHLVDLEYTFSVADGFHAMGTATMALPTKN
jgi:acyl dehydratase